MSSLQECAGKRSDFWRAVQIHNRNGRNSDFRALNLRMLTGSRHGLVGLFQHQGARDHITDGKSMNPSG